MSNMIGMIKNLLIVLMYIVWVGVGVALIASISQILPGQLGALVIIVLLFPLTYLPIRLFNAETLNKVKKNYKNNNQIKKDIL
ncbi:hypothetical protein FD06_GL000117 [Apilactobacillus ozensis DSM 23829 = JCM 17196]|uniref:Uncharacterized protein n=2 Tax=Apilactobacillus ozensis TaxID=866801 RepID=A0A0R2ARK7_9LACO|nr:hypothetical protein FD06_GL000117 [Apilactobacillus ozensis DSM 23829 = JCM 17196]